MKSYATHGRKVGPTNQLFISTNGGHNTWVGDFARQLVIDGFPTTGLGTKATSDLLTTMANADLPANYHRQPIGPRLLGGHTPRFAANTTVNCLDHQSHATSRSGANKRGHSNQWLRAATDFWE